MTSQNHIVTSESSCPIVRPVAPAAVATSRDVTGPSAASSPTNTSPLSRTKTTPGRRVVGVARRAHLRAELTRRDQRILAAFGMHRFLSAAHVQRLCFPVSAQLQPESALREARRALGRLSSDGVVRPVIPRRVGGIEAGSGAQLWQLTSAGHRLAVETSVTQWVYRSDAPTTRFLAHELGIVEAHLAALAAATTLGASAAVDVERQAARRYSAFGGGSLRLSPDLALVLSGRDDEGPFEDHWFLEVDLGTESLPTVMRKLEQYETYYRSGCEQGAIGTFPLVVWWLRGPKREARAAELRRRLAASQRLTAALHRFVTGREDQLSQLLASGGVE